MMIDATMLQRWTAVHASHMAQLHVCASQVLSSKPLSADAAHFLNSVEACCADLAMESERCQRMIRARYDESRTDGVPSPEDAREAVEHLRRLREVTQEQARRIKAECRHWCNGTWDKDRSKTTRGA